jgi:tetratricopeptide (TPR) repeat protein
MAQSVFRYEEEMENGHWDAAETRAREALEASDDSDGWLKRLAVACLAQGRFSEGLQALDRAACLPTSSIESLLMGSVVLADLGFYPEATLRYEAALTLQHEKNQGPEAELWKMHLQLAKSYASLVDFQSAYEQWQCALKIEENAEVLFYGAELFFQQKEWAKSLEHLEKARKLAPQEPRFQVWAAQCHLAMGQTERAKEALLRAEAFEDSSGAGQMLRRSVFPAPGV